MSFPQISILGCGWLGQPLALDLLQSGHKIVATCRSKDKAIRLQELGLSTAVYALGDDLTQGHLTEVFNSKLLILNIPVGRKTPDSNVFLNNIHSLLIHAAKSSIDKIIFISTTSIYGEPEGVVVEQTTPHPVTESAKVNLAIEGLVKRYFAERSTIIRLAGLVGADRHPAKFLAGKLNLANPNQVVNLIHQLDVISAIKHIIKFSLWSKTLHLSATQHPSRDKYYTYAAKQLGLTPPTFIDSPEIKSGKIIDASSSLNILKMTLAYPNPFDMLGDKA